MQMEIPQLHPVKVLFSIPGGELQRTPGELFRTLSELMEGRLASLVLTANRTRILSCRPVRGRSRDLDLRLHGCFLDAEAAVLSTVARYALGEAERDQRRRDLGILRRHFEEHRHRIGATRDRRPTQSVRLDPRGRTVDLREIFADLNRQYFENRIDAAITWGRALPKKRLRRGRQRTLRLGSYDEARNLIRIHRALDDPKVPSEVLESVIYHEMLHADLGSVVKGGRRFFHTPEFRRRERLYSGFADAERWLEKNLPYLLGARWKRC